MPAMEFVAEVSRHQASHHGESVPANAAKGVDDLVQLAAEDDAQEDVATSVKQSTKRIEKNEPGEAHPGAPRQRWREGAQAGNEFCHDQAAHAESCEKVL